MFEKDTVLVVTDRKEYNIGELTEFDVTCIQHDVGLYDTIFNLKTHDPRAFSSSAQSLATYAQASNVDFVLVTNPGEHETVLTMALLSVGIAPVYEHYALDAKGSTIRKGYRLGGIPEKIDQMEYHTWMTVFWSTLSETDLKTLPNSWTLFWETRFHDKFIEPLFEVVSHDSQRKVLPKDPNKDDLIGDLAAPEHTTVPTFDGRPNVADFLVFGLRCPR